MRYQLYWSVELMSFSVASAFPLKWLASEMESNISPLFLDPLMRYGPFLGNLFFLCGGRPAHLRCVLKTG